MAIGMTTMRHPVKLALLSILAILILVMPVSVSAEDQQLVVHSISQKDLDGDGQIDVTLIDCAFVTAEDRIHVVDRGSDMQVSSAWEVATDFENDIWMYDIGADAKIELIAVYGRENGKATAYLYDDRDGDGEVAYEFNGNQIHILESPFWSAKVLSGSEWFLPDGRLNLDVSIFLDGPFYRTFDRMPKSFADDWMHHDGKVDIVFEESADPEGVATWAMTRLVADSPPGWLMGRTGLYSNNGRSAVTMPSRAFFPFLAAPEGLSNYRYFDLPPTIRVDWELGAIESVGLNGYPIGRGYHVNSNDYAVSGEVNDASFEAPHAYYDLAGDGDSYPDLNIRLLVQPRNEGVSGVDAGLPSTPWQAIRYSWRLDASESLTWDFKVGMAGDEVIDQFVRVGNVTLRMVPYEELPWWATEHNWKLTTFVAREGAPYVTSEGIYEWDPDAGADPIKGPQSVTLDARLAAVGYMLGAADDAPEAYFQTTHAGFRGEYRFREAGMPQLYFSPIDRKLHLIGADAGLWTLEDDQIIRYADLDRDGFVDAWLYVQEGVVTRQLFVTESHIILSNEGSLIVQESDVNPAVFQVLPPRDHEEWRLHEAFLRTNAPRFAPADFEAMMDQFTGKSWRIDGAAIRDFRVTNEGYRFVVDLESDFRVVGKAPLSPDVAPGTYVAAFDQSLSVAAMVPASLVTRLSTAQLAMLDSEAIKVTVANSGLDDVHDAALELWAAPIPEGPEHMVRKETITALAESSTTYDLPWAPPSAGAWSLRSRIIEQDGRVTEGEPIVVRVDPPSVVSRTDVVRESAGEVQVALLFVILVAVASIAAFTTYSARPGPSADGE